MMIFCQELFLARRNKFIWEDNNYKTGQKNKAMEKQPLGTNKTKVNMFKLPQSQKQPKGMSCMIGRLFTVHLSGPLLKETS